MIQDPSSRSQRIASRLRSLGQTSLTFPFVISLVRFKSKGVLLKETFLFHRSHFKRGKWRQHRRYKPGRKPSGIIHQTTVLHYTLDCCLRKYVASSSSGDVFLTNSSVKADFENQGAHRLAKQFDPEGKRTVGKIVRHGTSIRIVIV